MHHIGQLNEQPLHAALKAHYAQPPAQTEVLVDGYLVDVVHEGELIEIQTGNFSAIKRKLHHLVAQHPVRLVYPIAVEKWILKTGVEDHEKVVRRKSPKRGRQVEVFAELVSFPQLVLEPNFSLELVMIQEEEVRRYIGKKRWHRNGWQTVERRLVSVLEQEIFSGPAAFARLLPYQLPETFTTADIAAGMGVSLWLAQKTAYCLREMGAITRVGKQGRSSLYVIDEGMQTKV